MPQRTPASERATVCARAPGLAESSSRPLVHPIDMSVVYCPDDLDHVDALCDGESKGFIYARDAHPNAAQLAEKMARLEGARSRSGVFVRNGRDRGGFFHSPEPERPHALIRGRLRQDQLTGHSATFAVGDHSRGHSTPPTRTLSSHS